MRIDSFLVIAITYSSIFIFSDGRRVKNYRDFNGNNTSVDPLIRRMMRTAWKHLNSGAKRTNRKKSSIRLQHKLASNALLARLRGPPGPQGPPGPAGSTITHEEIVRELRQIVNASPMRRVKRYDDKSQEVSLFAAGIADVLSAFVVKLSKHLVVTKKTFAYLREYQHGLPGSFIRGSGLDLHTGRFTAPYTAIYQFQASVHIVRPVRAVRMRPHYAITARICINSDCHHNLSLKHRVGVMSSSKSFTINVFGNLFLERGRYVEVIVENTASSKITVLSDTTFNGCLIGS